MDTGHQSPATSSSVHVAESLIFHPISCGQVVYPIWKHDIKLDPVTHNLIFLLLAVYSKHALEVITF